MRSYLEMLNELMEAVESDTTIPKHDKTSIEVLLRTLLKWLWKYSY